MTTRADSLPPGLREGPIYLDYNATTPVDPRVLEACEPFLSEHFGNPSSRHRYGQVAKAAIERAREQVATLVGCRPGEVVFTGGGSESDTLAIRGTALARRHLGDTIVTQPTEHPAVLAACDGLRRLHGSRIVQLDVDGDGLVAPSRLAATLDDRTVLVSIMHANNETGTIQPIDELAEVARSRGALLHTDASQSGGKVPISELGADLVTITGHKMYAPKGVGALCVRDGLVLEPSIYGGGQEHGRRSGTENVALVVALGRAAELAIDALADADRTRLLRDELHARLDRELPGRVTLNGHPHRRLPNTLNVSITGCNAHDLLTIAGEVAASTGSACHEDGDTPSPTLTAMGVSPERAREALRLTLGRWTTNEEIVRAVDCIAQAVHRPHEQPHVTR